MLVPLRTHAYPHQPPPLPLTRQYSDEMTPYLNLTKALYKDLVTVQKTSAVRPCSGHLRWGPAVGWGEALQWKLAVGWSGRHARGGGTPRVGVVGIHRMGIRRMGIRRMARGDPQDGSWGSAG